MPFRNKETSGCYPVPGSLGELTAAAFDFLWKLIFCPQFVRCVVIPAAAWPGPGDSSRSMPSRRASRPQQQAQQVWRSDEDGSLPEPVRIDYFLAVTQPFFSLPPKRRGQLTAKKYAPDRLRSFFSPHLLRWDWEGKICPFFYMKASLSGYKPSPPLFSPKSVTLSIKFVNTFLSPYL